jgi:hypothetical protein
MDKLQQGTVSIFRPLELIDFLSLSTEYKRAVSGCSQLHILEVSV